METFTLSRYSPAAQMFRDGEPPPWWKTLTLSRYSPAAQMFPDGEPPPW